MKKPQKPRRKPTEEEPRRAESKPTQKPPTPPQSAADRAAQIAAGKRSFRKASRLERARAGAPKITDLEDWQKPDDAPVASRTSERERNEENTQPEEHQDEKTAP